MDTNLGRLLCLKKGEIPLLMGLIILFFMIFSPVLAPSHLSEAEAGFRVVAAQDLMPDTPLIQKNSFLISASHYLPENQTVAVLESIQMKITAYSSSIWETDDTPFITAANTQVRDGIIASNLLPFGTKVRIPEYFGSKVFVVEDRMNERMGDFAVDIWFPSTDQARLFGVKYTYIETIR